MVKMSVRYMNCAIYDVEVMVRSWVGSSFGCPVLLSMPDMSFNVIMY